MSRSGGWPRAATPVAEGLAWPTAVQAILTMSLSAWLAALVLLRLAGG